MSPGISYEEWIAALEAPRRGLADGAYSSAEWMERLGKTKDLTMRWLREGIAAGWLEYAGSRLQPRIDARLNRVPTYRLIPRDSGGEKCES